MAGDSAKAKANDPNAQKRPRKRHPDEEKRMAEIENEAKRIAAELKKLEDLENDRKAKGCQTNCLSASEEQLRRALEDRQNQLKDEADQINKKVLEEGTTMEQSTSQAQPTRSKYWYCTGGVEVSAGHAYRGEDHPDIPGDFKDVKKFWEKRETYSSGLLAKTKVEGFVGPLELAPYAANGNDWLQSYGFVFNVNRREYAFDRVRVGLGPKNWDSQVDQPIGPPAYVAQAEAYFDCDGSWLDPQCNGGAGAAYRMAWRSRLRRVRTPSWPLPIAGTSALLSMISASPATTELAGRLVGVDLTASLQALGLVTGKDRFPSKMTH
jgi:hypothetical protein